MVPQVHVALPWQYEHNLAFVQDNHNSHLSLPDEGPPGEHPELLSAKTWSGSAVSRWVRDEEAAGLGREHHATSMPPEMLPPVPSWPLMPSGVDTTTGFTLFPMPCWEINHLLKAASVWNRWEFVDGNFFQTGVNTLARGEEHWAHESRAANSRNTSHSKGDKKYRLCTKNWGFFNGAK